MAIIYSVSVERPPAYNDHFLVVPKAALIYRFNCIIPFDAEEVPENTKLAILEGLELQIFLAPSQPW